MARPVSDFARQAAKQAGQKRYFGKPCTFGHGVERVVSTRACVVCQAERTRVWRQANREHRKAYQESYSARNQLRLIQNSARYRAENRDRRLAAVRLWKQNNRHRCVALQMKRHSAKLRRTPLWLTEAHFAEIEGFYLFAKFMECMTSQKYHVDHIIPLQGKAVSGLHVPWNLQVIPAVENQRKGAKHDREVLLPL